jgi:type I restriction enzyme S subunit
LPSIAEQKKIVDKLDMIFAEIDKTISSTKQKKIEEKNIKLSILKSIFSINNSQKTIGKIAAVIAGQSPEGKYYNKTAKGIPFYQGKKEFGDYELKKPNVWTTKITKVSLKGDVLLSVRAPVGETNINNEKICIGRGLAAIRANKECNSEFIYYFLNSIKDKIVGNTGAVFNSINKKQIEDIIIPAPSSDEQTQIVNKIKSIFSLMNEINLLTKQKLDNLNILKSSILKQELRNKAA